MIHITKDNFVWKDVTSIFEEGHKRIAQVWSAYELYEVTEKDNNYLIMSWDDIKSAINVGSRICIKVGHLPQSYCQRKLWDGVEKKLIDGYWYAKISDQTLA
jgi:hypothetical protein